MIFNGLFYHNFKTSIFAFKAVILVAGQQLVLCCNFCCQIIYLKQALNRKIN